MRYIIIILTIIINTAISQTVYEIPFPEGKNNSKDNVIELSISNNSELTAEEVKVEADNIPKGITFTEEAVLLAEIKPKEEQTAVFSFSVDKTAIINKEQTISFTITDKTGQTWTKDITIKISPPKTFELYQNYPNPFNPITTIAYQLPDIGTQYIVTIKIYDILGREVIAINKEQASGYYEQRIDAAKLSSGIYVYRIHAKPMNGGKSYISTKKMVVIK